MAIEGTIVASPRRRFGVLFYTTAIVALVILVSIPLWQTGVEQSRAWWLTRRLHDPVEDVRRTAVYELVQLGPAASPWVIRAMRDPDARVRLIACSIVVRTAPDAAKRPLGALLGAVSDGDSSVRLAAVGQLEALIFKYGSPSENSAREKALHSICAALRDTSPQVRAAAGWALFRLGRKAKSAIPELDQALLGADKPLRVVAADAMLRIDPSATRPHIAAAMRELLTDQSIPHDHWRAVRNLALAQGADATAAMLVPLLKDKDIGTRHQAIYDLIQHCAHAKTLRSTLIEALASDDGGLRDEAALYLLKHDASMARRAIETIAEQIVDPLNGSYLLWDLIRKTRKESPGSITPLVPALVTRLARASNPDSRVNAIMALGEIGPEAKPAVPAMLEASGTADLEIAGRAVEALVKVDPQLAATRLSSLLDWMRSGQVTSVRLSAMASLRDLGPAAATALPALLKVAGEEDLTISAAAIEAISKIDPATGAALKQAIAEGALRSRDD
jgi:HEAT repeat protein